MNLSLSEKVLISFVIAFALFTILCLFFTIFIDEDVTQSVSKQVANWAHEYRNNGTIIQTIKDAIKDDKITESEFKKIRGEVRNHERSINVVKDSMKDSKK